MKLFPKLVVLLLVPMVFVAFASVYFVNAQRARLVAVDANETVRRVLTERARNMSAGVTSARDTLRLLAESPVLKSGDLAGIRATLKTWRLKSDRFEAFYFNLPDGTVYPDEGPVFSVADRPYFRDQKAGREVFGETLVSRATKQPVLLMTTPLKDGEGRWVGALGGTLKLDSMLMVELVDMPIRGVKAFVLDEEGRLLAGGLDPKMTMFEKVDAVRFPRTAAVIAGMRLDFCPAPVRVNVGDEPMLVLCVRVPELMWRLVLVQSEAELLAPIRYIRTLAYSIISIASLFVGFGAYIFYRTVARPLGRLSAAHAALQKGDTEVRVPVRGGGELSELADSFNRMAESLKVSEQRFRTVFAMFPHPVALTRLSDGKYIDVNPAFCEFDNFKREEVLGKSAHELGITLDADDTKQKVRVLKEAGRLDRAHATVRLRDGRLRWIEYSSRIIDLGGEKVLLTAAVDITEQHEAAETVRQAEATYRGIFENSPDTYYRSDENDCLVMISPAGEKLLGYRSAEEVLGRTITSFWVETDRRTDLWRMLEESGMVQDYPVLLRRCDGGTVMVSVSTRLMRNEEGRMIGVEGVLRDVTQRYREEQARREMEARYRRLHDSMMDGFVSCSLDGILTESNRAYQEMVGYSAEELRGMDYRLFTPERWHAFEEDILMRQVRVRGFSDVYQKEYRHRDGHIFPVELRVYLETNASGEAVGYWGVIRDVTQMRQTTDALQLSQRRLQMVAEGMRDILLFIEASGVIRYVTPSVQKLLGLDAAGLLGQQPLAGIEAADKARFENLIKQSIGGVRGNPQIFRFAHPNGRTVFLEITADPVIAKDGERTGCVVLGRDVSERIQAEEERARLQAQLMQSQKMEAIGLLSGGIAHDFNNVLGAILGNAQLARMDVPSGHPSADSLDQIIKASRRAAQLVRQIVTFARQESVEYKTIDLRPVVAESVRLLRATIPAGIDLRNILPPEPMSVLANETQIQQVIVNLGTNSWHAIDETTGWISVEVDSVEVSPAQASQHPDLHKGPYVRLRVSDSGHGMDVATQRRIFDPFFTTKTPDKGTGLGLSVVHGIIKAHGGAIVVTSAPGKGATFDLYFPAAALNESAREAAKNEIRCGDGERVLLLDDEEIMIRTMSRALTRLGYRVTTFTDVGQALLALAGAPNDFDLLITDLNMPSLSGIDVARQALRIRKDLPVLLSTGYLTPEADAALDRTLIRGLVHKPSSVPELAESVYRCLHPAPRHFGA